MAFMIKKLNDPSGILFLMLLALPLTATTNIDCNGKPFHCLNSTHFMICVDLGTGVSGTLDDFVIPCPPPTVCQGTNRFECEFPTVPTQAPQPLEPITLQTTTFYQATEVSQNIDVNRQFSTVPSETATLHFEDYYNTLSSTTLSHNDVSPGSSIATDSSFTDVFEVFNNTTFENHENLETAGSGPTQDFTTGPHINQTELFNSSTKVPETLTLQTLEMDKHYTTVVTEASTNLDTVTTPTNEITTKRLEVTTNLPYLTSTTVESSQTTQAGDQDNASLSTSLSDMVQIKNTTQETASTASNFENQIIPVTITTEMNQAVTDVVNTVNSTQSNEITQSLSINNNNLTSTVTERAIDLTTEVLLPSTGIHNISVEKIPNVVVEATAEPNTTAEFENIVNVQYNKTDPSTKPTSDISTITVKEINQVKPSTLSLITDTAATMIETVITTDGITSNSPLSTTESYISTVPNTLPVSPINLTFTLGPDKVSLTSVPPTTIASVLTTNGLTISKVEVTAAENNTMYNTSDNPKSSTDFIESSIPIYEIMNTSKDIIALEPSLKYDTNNVTQPTIAAVTDTNIDVIHNNTISDNKHEVQNVTLSDVGPSTAIESVTVNENSNSVVLLNASAESLEIITETTQHPSIDEVYSTQNLIESTSQSKFVQTEISIDGNTKGLQTTESVPFSDESVTNIENKPELNEIITQPPNKEILTTMSLKKSADIPLELTTATNIVNSESITNTESNITSQPSTSVITLNAPDINNNISDSISQNISKITISDKSTSYKVEGSDLQQMELSTIAVHESVQNTKTDNTNTYTTIVTTVTIPQRTEIQAFTESLPSVNHHTILSASSSSIDNSYNIPTITIATPSADKTKPTDPSSTVTTHIPNHTVHEVLTFSNDQIAEIPTTMIPVVKDQNKINIENNKDDVVHPVNNDNQINSKPVTDKAVDNKSYNTNQASNVIQSTTNFGNNVAEQDTRNVPSQENVSLRLDSITPMVNTETLLYITEPIQSNTVASHIRLASKISDDPLSTNILNNKYQNAIAKNNLDSTPLSSGINKNHLDSTTLSTGIESTPLSQGNDFNISTEPTSVKEMISTPFSEQQLNEDNSVTLTNDQSNQEINNVMIDSTILIPVEPVLENTAKPLNNIDMGSKLNVTPSEIVQPSDMSLSSKQEQTLRTNTKYNITKGAEVLVKNQAQRQFGVEQSKNLVLSPVNDNQDVDDQLNNERIFFTDKNIKVQPNDAAPSLSVKVERVNTSTLNYKGTSSLTSTQIAQINEQITNKTTGTEVDMEPLNTYKNYSMANLRYNDTILNSSNVIKPPDITAPISNIINSKILAESTTINRTTFTLIPSGNLSANKINGSIVAEKNDITSKTPRNAQTQFAQTTNTIIMVVNSNSPTEVTHFGTVFMPPKHQDKHLKTNSKDLEYNDENSVMKPSENVSHNGQDQNNTTSIKSNENSVLVPKTSSPKTLNIDDEENNEFTEGNVNELSESSYTPNMIGGNVELSRPTVSTRVEAAEAVESDIMSIPQLSKREELSTQRSSISYTPQANVTPKTIIKSTSRSVAITANAVVKPFLCNPFLRGRFADNHDCRKFYICIGWPLPMTGTCPVNTVFSEIRKQCTKNLSHCVRNNQFQCVSEGRFSDFLNDNFYYICVKNKLNHFIRFKLRCQNGYHLNKTSVRCVLNSESSQSISISDKSISDQSGSLAKLEKKRVSSDFECEKEGKFADPSDCRTYYICKIRSDSEFKRKKKKCDSDEYFHNDKKRCVDAESYECNI